MENMETMQDEDIIGIAAANARNPGEPEYGKGWKAENNAGCCGGCGEDNCKDSREKIKRRVVFQRKVRQDFE